MSSPVDETWQGLALGDAGWRDMGYRLRGDFGGDFVAPVGALLHTVGSERSRKLLKNKGLKLAPLHGVQGVASSNPAVPTSSSKGRQ